MTAPVSSRHLADLMAARDSSLPLAAAALARVADEAGRAAFSELAIAYREEFLMLRAHSRDAGLPELEGLSVEEFRTSLRTSVLPRLALMNVVTYAAAALEDTAPIAFTGEAWGEIAADRSASADRLLDAAERALARAEPASGAASKSPARSSPNPSSCCLTSRSPAWIRSRCTTSRPSWPGCATAASGC